MAEAQTSESARLAFAESAARHEDRFRCLIWPFKGLVHGYGQLEVDGQPWRAHRYVLTLAKGSAPQGKPWALHAPIICHTKRCVNPHHLDWGDPAENAAHRLLDGTQQRGEGTGTSILTELEVLEIRQAHAAGATQYELSREYGVANQTISKVVRGKTWAHVGGPIWQGGQRKALSVSEIEEIKQQRADGVLLSTLAERYGVHLATISRVCRGRYDSDSRPKDAQ